MAGPGRICADPSPQVDSGNDLERPFEIRDDIPDVFDPYRYLQTSYPVILLA